MIASGVSISVGNVVPKIRLPLKNLNNFDLLSDLFGRADTDVNGYDNWWLDHLFLLVSAQQYVAKEIVTLASYLANQKPARFSTLKKC